MSATATKPPGSDASALPARLRELIRAAAPPALCVGFSGGPDSTALLHALAQLPEARDRGLRAIHVDHGLHADSAAWSRQCADFCAALDLPLTTVRVQVDTGRGEGIEAAARHARRKAFAEHLVENEWLLLAHHRDDQVETVLLKLLRGAGPEGLGGMRERRPFGHGTLWRPLLETPRAVLLNYLTEKDLSSIDDPANDDPGFSRNRVRHVLLPVIAKHWPNADASILHAARLCRDTADYVWGEADTALAGLWRDAGTLDTAGWLALPDALRAPTLDTWLRARGCAVPPDASRAELERQTARASGDRMPRVAWPGAEVRAWDGRLHALPPLAPPPVEWQARWNGASLDLPADCGSLRLEAEHSDAASTRLPHPLSVRFRHGGERLKPHDDPHTRELRDLFQQVRMEPWLRERCPLIYEDDQLVAVADLWSSERAESLFAACNARPRWRRPAWG
jgi:tRNA(Ile)-lysidine synthase